MVGEMTWKIIWVMAWLWCGFTLLIGLLWAGTDTNEDTKPSSYSEAFIATGCLLGIIGVAILCLIEGVSLL